MPSMTFARIPDGRARFAPRASAALASIAIMVALGLTLMFGLRVTVPRAAETAMSLFQVLPPPTPPPDLPTSRPSDRRAGAAAPPARKAKAAALTAPKPVLTPPPPPITLSQIKGVSGIAPVPGAAEVDGPGSGAGGQGNGMGSGAGGTGTGAGLATESVRIGGAITNRDYPSKARRANAQGAVTVAYVVDTDGRAHDCAVVRSSGSDALDAQTCTLIEKRFRFRPARDAAGNAMAETRGWQQRWWFAR